MGEAPGLSPEQLTELFVQARARLLSRFRRMGLAHVAEDLYQDTFRKLLTTKSVFQWRAQATTYIMAAGINVARDYLRAESINRTLSFGDQLDHQEGYGQVLEGIDCDADPVLQVMAQERHELMRELFSSLKTQDQQLLRLDEQGLDSTSIANKTGLTRQAVHTRLSRLKRRLREETTV